MTPIAEETHARITAALAPSELDIRDDSAQHAGHKGDRAHGGAHLFVSVVSPMFTGLSLVERHRMVYAAVGDLMQQQIHALSMKTLAPEETSSQ